VVVVALGLPEQAVQPPKQALRGHQLAQNLDLWKGHHQGLSDLILGQNNMIMIMIIMIMIIL